MEVNIDDELDAMEAKARAWDMLEKYYGASDDNTQYAYELREKMNLLLKFAQEKEEECDER